MAELWQLVPKRTFEPLYQGPVRYRYGPVRHYGGPVRFLGTGPPVNMFFKFKQETGHVAL